MNWNSFGEFLSMGGYGLYVWGSYGVTFAVLGLEVWNLKRRHGAALRHARARAGKGPK